MKTIVFINSVGYGSTGKIVKSLIDVCVDNGDSAYVCLPKGRHNKKNEKNIILFGNRFSEDSHIILSRLTGKTGVYSYFATKRLVRKLKIIKPDVLHLHNLHNSFINLSVLFDYIKQNNTKVVWTLHDCWAFTGHCPHFTMAKCDKWETGCYKCPQYREYPQSLFDNSKKMYRLKKKWFTGIQNLTIVTPSEWLADLVKRSFLKDYPVQVINNGIDLSVFKPTESNFRERYDIPAEKYILLGVAFGWGARKGLDVFIELSKRLPDNYQIVLVGTNDKTDKQLPKNIVSIHRTQNQTELAEIYTAADLFVNPTREENYPTVNMESLACGTPVLTFRTGGSPEIIDGTCGSVVDCDDIDGLESEIKRIYEENPYSKDACLTRAKAFDMNERFQEYIKLYNSCVG